MATWRKGFRLALFLTVLCVIGGCQTPPPSYDAFRPKPALIFEVPLFEYSQFRDQPAGIAISAQGRVFVTFPRWTANPSYSVAEIMEEGGSRPFPDALWNTWGRKGASPETHFICAQSLSIDNDDNLWILDSASPFFRGIADGAKLVKVNLKSNQVEQVVKVDRQAVTVDSYLSGLCIDSDRDIAYISDSGTGAIIVTDLTAGATRRLLSGHTSTRAKEGYVPAMNDRPLAVEDGLPPFRHVSSIALDSRGEYLYYHALFARNLYRIAAKFLRDPIYTPEQVANKVEKVMDTGAVAGMLMNDDDNLFLSLPENKAIKRIGRDGKVTTIVQDEHLQWPDQLAISPDSYLYFTDSQVNRMPQFNGGTDRRKRPYRMFKIFLPTG